MTPQMNSHHRALTPLLATASRNCPPCVRETIQHLPAALHPAWNAYTLLWTSRTSTAHPVRPPLAPSPSPDTRNHRRPQAPPCSPPLGWYGLQEHLATLTVKALWELNTPDEGLHEAIAPLVLCRAGR